MVKSFAFFLSDHHVSKRPIHDDNQEVMVVLNAMVSAKPAVMAGLRKLRALFYGLGVTFQAHRMYSAVKRFAKTLCSTWDTD